MNTAQKLWWQQAQSDHDLFIRLRRERDVSSCHLLHYLQMATEKLSKAYFWRTGNPPPKTHVGFVRFLRAVLVRRPAELARISNIFGFNRPEAMDKWVFKILPLAYALQNLAPAEAGNGPNPEYPWPHEAPIHHPSGHTFELWTTFSYTGQGRKLMEFIHKAMKRFDAFA